MQKSQGRQMISDLSQALGNRRFLKKFSLTKKAALALLRSEDWSSRLMEVAQMDGPCDCARILSLCQSTLDRLSPEPEEGWLLYSYRFAVDGMFPDADFAPRREAHGDGALFFLAVLQVVFDAERRAGQQEEALRLPLLGEDALADCDRAEEYRRFIDYFRREYVYEMMRLGCVVTPFCTLEHIAGVHRVAMTVGAGLRAAGAPVDLSLVSGAAAGHDLGKFGCKPGERVPYLHYYYTDRWFTQRGMEAIGHIAANHSTWDLELENLSAESLLLIYADFRVKQLRDERGAEITRVYSLDDSFDVILKKLDDVDDAKRRRYAFVYAKLRDFEDYMRQLGIDVGLDGAPSPRRARRDIALMGADEAIEALKFLGIEHNIGLMHRLSSERQFGNILEAARSEKKWKNIRAYISIFEEYFTYLSAGQKVQTLGFLYELLMHREGDIRRQAAGLVGNIIAHFNEGYRKELPNGATDADDLTAFSMWEKYLDLLIYPDHKLAVQHKSWVGYTLKIVAASVLDHCAPADRTRYLGALLRYYEQPNDLDDLTAFVLLDAMLYLPLPLCDEEAFVRLADFAGRLSLRASIDIRAASLRAMRRLADALTGECAARARIAAAALDFVDDDSVTLVFLKGRLLRALGLDDQGQQALLARGDIVSDIFLDNLKTATPWVVKAVNIKLLLDQLDRGHTGHLLHIAAHFSNLIKVSERVVVRHDAGAALLKIAPLLSLDQRNEIAVELVKGLEVGEYEFSKYIPQYLGEFALWLHPDELDEIIAQLDRLLASSNDRIVSVALSTAAVLLECFPVYRPRFPEPDDVYRRRREHLLGMLLGALANFREPVRQEALLVIGQTLFGSSRLSEHEKRRIFSLSFKKLLFLICEYSEGELTFFYRAAALNHIYRFITEQSLRSDGFDFDRRDRVAFFPGTFDPFTLSHKGIVRAIRDLGFEVMLAIDEFSWSKKTQPRLIRRQIVSMSVADEFHVHVFPDSIPVNLSNPDDLRRLRECFPDKRVYIVVGSDVVDNASSYKAEPTPHSIHHWDHIIFRRASTPDDGARQTGAALARVFGDVLELSLPLHLEDISSTRIRENIDRNRDISNLIDPAAQEFIYANSLYLREPQYKPILRARAIAFERVERPDGRLLDELCAAVLFDHPARDAIREAALTRGDALVVMRNDDQNGRAVGFAGIRELGLSELYSELQNAELANFVRQHAAGKIALLTGIFAVRNGGIDDVEQFLLTEALAGALAADCTYALFHPVGGDGGRRVLSALERQGFQRTPNSSDDRPLFAADMRAPVVLIQNLETTVKEPLSSSARVLAAIAEAHRRLQLSVTRLYPGSLVLSLPAGVIHHRLVDKITALNGVPSTPLEPRALGPYMCVPFGKILRGKVVPNTVTKTLHTDKVFSPDIKSSAIEAFPYYSPLESQIRTIRSFQRPVVLVDDLLHSGDRLLALDPLFRREEIDVKMVLVGMLSGYGRDLMAIRDRPVDSVYFIPNLRHWFVESTLYPFIGGDTVRREGRWVAGLQPSVNLILPYAAPWSAPGCSRQALFDLSLTCIENARDILLALETEYRALFERNLTLNRLSEAVILPLCPDKGGCMAYDPNLAASVYLENDIEMLLRTRNLMV